MSNPARQIPELKDHSIRWVREDWERVLQAVDVLNERGHLDLTPTDVIRAGTRRYLDELLAEKPVQKVS